MDPVGIVDLLYSLYGAEDSEQFRFQTPFQWLISTILSQQTTARNCIAASERLFSRYPDPFSLSEAELEEIEELVHPSGYYRTKAKAVKDISIELVQRFGGNVPDRMDDLLTLPKVGPKTAACTLMYGFGKPAMVVDTHIHRVSNRLGFVHTKNANETMNALESIIPPEKWRETDVALMSLGQKICRARNPECGRCPVAGECPSRVNIT